VDGFFAAVSEMMRIAARSLEFSDMMEVTARVDVQWPGY